MSSAPEIPAKDLLARVEVLLAQDPTDQDAALQELQKELVALRDNKENETLEKIYQAFGTAVGRKKEWQRPFREDGVLSLALEDLPSIDAPTNLKKQYLRVIGNSVADNDTNREIVVKELEKLIALLEIDDLSTIALIVLFNLCNDFDLAQATAAALRLDATISTKLASQEIPEEATDYAVDLLSWTTGKLTAEQLKDDTSLQLFAHLLKVALDYDEDHYHEYVAILVHYIQDPEFQSKIATPTYLDDLITLMLDFEERLTQSSPEDMQAVFRELAITKHDETSPSEETSVILLSQLINGISSLSASDAFAASFNIQSPTVERMPAKLAYLATDRPSSVCACVMLGNLAMSDEICIAMVHNMQLHLPLRDIFFFSKHSALLYAALGFLRHLAFPEQNRTELGDARIIEASQRFLAMYPDRETVPYVDDPVVRGEIGALLAKLVTNNPKNIERVVMYRVGEHRGEPGELPLRSVSNGPTCLGNLIEQSLEPTRPLPSTSMKNLSIEAGRTIVNILRYLGRTQPNEALNVDAVRERMLEITNIATPLAKLVRQRFYAEARSEGLLGLGLIAQSSGGAARVIQAIKEDPGLLEAIKDFAEGTDGGVEQQGQAAGRDYQNAIVLLQALRNNWGDEADEGLKDRIVSLQAHLGKLMV
ncbi:GTP binding protein-like protein [Paraphoma chrysanthemicola]|uniref:GTP binding protein-like protein n=1 Tax=Paraphoma chrysanthemicola TaxID=798071 RepID=A0A8K0R6K6_9PLEO|nr:GTP binding protein-like protein [Paraphoma chrysanthemicola]